MASSSWDRCRRSIALAIRCRTAARSPWMLGGSTVPYWLSYLVKVRLGSFRIHGLE